MPGHWFTADTALYGLDCRAVLPVLKVDSVVTDPPYELGFMGKSWDASGIAYDPEVWEGFRPIGCDSWDDAIAHARVRLGL